MAKDRAVPSREEIEVRAYEIYLERGADGSAEEDWLSAERELMGELADEAEPEAKAAAATASSSKSSHR